jgi:hypothetical protein
MSEEAQVVAKVQELMTTLDQVKKYKALSKLLVDFALIMLATTVVLLAWELSVNFYKLGTGFYCYYGVPGLYTCTASPATGSPLLRLFGGLSTILIPTAGLLGGILWVDHKLKLVKVGEWTESLREGFPGAVKLLEELKWDSVFQDIRASRIGYSAYLAVKVVGYWLLATVVMFFPYVFGVSALHLEANFYVLGLLSLVLVLVVSKNDLQRKYQQVVSLDNLMWELRWFSSGFKSAKFEA